MKINNVIKKKKHICFVSQSFYPSTGGVSTMLVNLGKALVNEDYQVTFIHLGEHDSVKNDQMYCDLTIGFDRFKEEILNKYSIFKEIIYKDFHNIEKIQHQEISRLIGYDAFCVINNELKKEIRKLHAEHPIDILHAHDYQVILCTQAVQVPVVLFSSHFPVHDNISDAVGNFIKENTRVCKRFIVSTEMYKSVLIKKRFISQEVLLVLEPVSGNEYNKVDLLSKSYRYLKLITRKVFSKISIQKTTVLCVQRFDSKSGYIDIVKTANLIKEYPISFIFVGEGSLTDKISTVRKSYFNEAKKLTEELGLQSKISFVGNIPYISLKEFYNIADIFIILSKMECYGLAVTEAMSQMLPIIATDVPGFSHQIKDGYNGFLVCGEMHADIASKILKLHNDKNKLIQFSKNSRKIYEQKFLYKIILKKYIDMYKFFV